MAGIVARLFGRKPAATEQRDMYSPWNGGVGSVLAGGPVAGHVAESLSAVTGCIELISGAIASLPATLTIDTPDGQAPAPSTATAWTLLRRPSPLLAWPAFIRLLAAQLLAHGNSINWLSTDGRGAVASLTPIPWPWLNPVVIGGAAGAPRLVFDVVHSSPEAQLLGLPRRLTLDECLFVRSRTDNGILGRSVLQRAAGALSNALEVQSFAESTWRHSAMPSGLLELPPGIKPEGKRRLEAHIEGHNAGTSNAGRILFVDRDTKWTQLSISPGDLQLLGSRAYATADICRMFGVPEALIQPGDHPPADLAPFVAAFAQLCLAPIVADIEAEFDAAVLPAGMHLRLDMGGLMRGSFSAAMGAAAVGVQSGILTGNDGRRMFSLPAHDDGDVLRASAAPTYPADAKGVPSLAPKPGPTGDGLPNTGTHEGDGAV